jgi:hypothetical protein
MKVLGFIFVISLLMLVKEKDLNNFAKLSKVEVLMNFKSRQNRFHLKTQLKKSSFKLIQSLG